MTTAQPFSFFSVRNNLSHAPLSMGDDFYRVLMEESQMAFFDYDVPADDLCLSVAAADGQRRVRRYRAFLRTLRNRKSIPAELQQSLLATARRCCSEPGKSSFSICLDLLHSGEYRWYLVFLHSLCDDEQRVNRVIGHLRDVQAEKLTELRLQNLAIYRHAVDSASLFVFEFDLPHFVASVVSDSQRCSADFYPLGDYLCPASRHLIHPDDRDTLQELLSEENLLAAYHAQQYELTRSLRILNRHAQWIWICLTIHLSYGGNSREAHGIGYIQVIQDRMTLEERAKLDCVTGLFNRGSTEEQINRVLTHRAGPAYFFIFDIDDFKSVNDTQGHAEGDRLLRLIAAGLRGCLRQSDILGRIGGDEFVALLTGIDSEPVAARKAGEFLAAVEKIKCPAVWQGGASLSISIGIARAPEDGLTFDALYRAADRALYRAKGAGKNCFCFDSKNQ